MTGPSGRYNKECERLSETTATKLTKERTDRPHCEALLDISIDVKPPVKVLNTDDEGLCPWADIVATPTIVSQPPRKRKQKDEASKFNHQEDAYKSYHTRQLSQVDKYDVPYVSLRNCVATKSWCYMPNNAQYRRAKAENRQSPDPSKRLSSRYVTAEQKQLQREIQQELRRQHEEKESKIDEKETIRQRSAKLTKSNKSPIDSGRAQGDMLGGESIKLHTNNLVTISSSKQQYIVETDHQKEQKHPVVRTISRNKLETSSQVSNASEQKEKKQDKQAKQLPPLEVPLGLRAHRPGAYLTTRLSIMEEEMRRDLVIRSSQDDSILSFRSRSEPASQRGQGERGNYMHPVLESLFTVKSLNKNKNSVTKTTRSLSQGKLTTARNLRHESPSNGTTSAPSSGTLRLTHAQDNSLKSQADHEIMDNLENRTSTETDWQLQESPISTRQVTPIEPAPSDPLQSLQDFKDFKLVSGRKGLHPVPAFQRTA